MRVGVVLPTRGVVLAGSQPDAGLLLSLAETAEAAGCDSVWVGDSLTAKPRLEPLAVLAAVAARTSRIGIGTSVLLAALRQPVLLAQTTATVDVIAAGRLTLGIGAGGAFTTEQQREWLAAGVPQRGRGARLAELVEVLQLLWSGESVTYAGRYIQLQDAGIGFSPPSGRVRTLLACHSGEGRAAQYARAARLADGMISITDSPQEFAAVRASVLDAIPRGRGLPTPFHAAFYMTINLNSDREAAAAEADAWIKRYYGLDFWGERWGPFGPPHQVLERARDYAGAGADELIFRFASWDQTAQLQRFCETILPTLK
jgi:alkanesulfonate monooxygenase SsuD/methylene tetrahydromethanopterin reductase-like flavin-dependent oxidoreductase (luciferase family)